jgi:hypothetical protein
MRKPLIVLCVAMTVLAAVARPARAAEKHKGGPMAFLVGALCGLRAGLEWNEGKDVHWREWCQVVPFVWVWNGITCAKGTTAHEFGRQNGTNWY